MVKSSFCHLEVDETVVPCDTQVHSVTVVAFLLYLMGVVFVVDG
jgi:hypothetical protein